jgi:tRNA threonylcarbamoyladenosine biosynthesis protein TsaE
MRTESRYLPDEAATEALGAELAEAVPTGVVWLVGGLGAGKTCLARGWLQALGHQEAVKSPTYTLVEPYVISGKSVYHLDLYRVGDPEELEMIGIRDYFNNNSLSLVEWPRRAAAVLPEPDLTIRLSVGDEGRNAELLWRG